MTLNRYFCQDDLESSTTPLFKAQSEETMSLPTTPPSTLETIGTPMVNRQTFGKVPDNPVVIATPPVHTKIIATSQDNIQDHLQSLTNSGQMLSPFDISGHLFDPASVLQGDIDIQALDMFSVLMGLQPPSCIYAATLSKGKRSQNTVSQHIVSPTDTFVQIHYIDSHYVVSHQQNQMVYVYDSLPSCQRVCQLLPQLTMLYEILKSNSNPDSRIKYIIAQHQGSTNDCGAYAAANAYFVSVGQNPQNMILDTKLLRQHLFQCLFDNCVTPFPCKPQTDRTTYLMDQYFTNSLKSKTIVKSCNTNTNVQPTKSKVVNRKDYFRSYEQMRRLDALFQEKEKKQSYALKQMARCENVYRQAERTKDCERRKTKRLQTEYKQSEMMKESAGRKTKRQQAEYRQAERTKDCERRKTKRLQTEYKQSEMMKESAGRKTKRQRAEYRQAERTKDCERRKTKRLQTEYKQSEMMKDSAGRKTKRQQAEYRQAERTKDCERRKTKRLQTEYKQSEMMKESTGRKTKRQRAEYRQAERTKDCERRKTKRLQTEYKQSEMMKESAGRKTKRHRAEYRQAERTKDCERRKTKRLQTEYKHSEMMKESTGRKTKRQRAEYRQAEGTKDCERRKTKRLQTEYKQSEMMKESTGRKTKRQRAEYRQAERTKDCERRKTKRLQTEYKQSEMMKESAGRKTKRQRAEYRQAETTKNSRRRKIKRNHSNAHTNILRKSHEAAAKQSKRKGGLTLQQRIRTFHALLTRGDDFVCTCCHQTFYQHSVLLASKTYYTSKGIPTNLVDRCFTGYKSTSDAEWICKTCHSHLSMSELPQMAQDNGFCFPTLPDVIKNHHPTETEERCCALRIPFMQIKELGVSKQYGIYGNTVNVPMNPAKVVGILPRRYQDTATIHLKFMRQMKNKRPVIHETIRPRVVYDITQYFILNSELYKEEGIQLNEEWFPSYENQNTEVTYEPDDENQQDCNNNDSDDNWDESTEDDQIRTGNRDTILTPCDFTDDGKHALKMAPGENNHPIALYLDKYAEEKSFPVLFGGKKRPTTRCQVRYSTICKAELGNVDKTLCYISSKYIF